MHRDGKQLEQISSEQSCEADNLEGDSRCVVAAVFVVVVDVIL